MAGKFVLDPAKLATLKQRAPSIATMFERGMRPSEIDRALGYAGAASQWINGGGVSGSSEANAANWLKAHQIDAKEPPEEPELPLATETPNGCVALVVVPPARVGSFKRVCAAMGVTLEDMQ